MPLASCAVAAAVFALLSGIAVDTSLVEMGVLLFALGFGIGLGQQMLVLMVQNEFPVSVVGTATASNNFFREIGATVGASLVGSLFTANLSARLGEAAAGLGDTAAGLDANALTPSVVHAMEPALQQAIQQAYHDALTPVFLVIAPLFVAGFVLLLFLKERPLAVTQEEAGEAREQAARA